MAEGISRSYKCTHITVHDQMSKNKNGYIHTLKRKPVLANTDLIAQICNLAQHRGLWEIYCKEVGKARLT